MAPDADDAEPRSGYEGWLDELAGERVRVGPIFLGWLSLLLPIMALALLTGADPELAVTGAAAATSLPFRSLAVPVWLVRRRERKEPPPPSLR